METTHEDRQMVAVTSEVNMAGGRPRGACRWVSRDRLEKNAAVARRHEKLTMCYSNSVSLMGWPG